MEANDMDLEEKKDHLKFHLNAQYGDSKWNRYIKEFIFENDFWYDDTVEDAVDLFVNWVQFDKNVERDILLDQIFQDLSQKHLYAVSFPNRFNFKERMEVIDYLDSCFYRNGEYTNSAARQLVSELEQ